MSETRDVFVFYRSYYEAIQKLSEGERLAVYEAIMSYALYGEEPDVDGVSAAIFMLIRPTIDAGRKKAESGRAGGYAKNKPEENASNSEANVKQTVSKTEANVKQTASNSKANAKQTPSKPEADPKQTASDKRQETRDKGQEIKDKRENSARARANPRTYGPYDNVMLTDADLEKLKAEFPRDWAVRIERLSEYMASSGKKYKNHLATIRSWERLDRAQAAGAGPPGGKKLQQYAERQYTDAELEALVYDPLKEVGV